MVRKVTALLLAVLLSLPACIFAETKPNSVQALQSEGRTFCTAWSINEKAGLWATAAHCAAYALEHDLDVTIDGQYAWVVYVGFPAVDIAVFQSDTHVKAFKLSKIAPEVGDALLVRGFPYGITRTDTKGSMGARRIPILHPSTNYYMTSDILDLTVAGGNSGSPVLNSKGDVVGVLWGGFTESAHSLSVAYEGTVQALSPFAGK